jgi:hypothetical protein
MNGANHHYKAWGVGVQILPPTLSPSRWEGYYEFK